MYAFKCVNTCIFVWVHVYACVRALNYHCLSSAVLLSGLSLWLQRMHALLIKRGIITYRSLFVLFIQIVVPVVALAGGLALLLSTSSQGVEPTLELGVSYFKSGASPTVQLREADFTGNSRQRFNLSQSVSFMFANVTSSVCRREVLFSSPVAVFTHPF